MVLDEDLTGEIEIPSSTDEHYNTVLADLKSLGFNVKRDVKSVKHNKCDS